ncbi:MAG: hypothetical protein IPF63_10705 [Bacteroidetes bacterium]|nr:hypothetical protein [Bacteroidota bacterium]
MVAKSVSILVVATGGARNIDDFKAINGGHASAVAAGSMFVCIGKHQNGTYLLSSQNELKESLYEKIY